MENNKPLTESSGLIIKVDKKTFINCHCFQINIGIAFAYIFIFSGWLLNIVNRIIFFNYNFRFNFTFTLMQQFVCLIIFTFVGTKNEIFIKTAGKISFRDFYKYKFYYLAFALIFLINILNNFYGYQLVENVSMFLCLRKLNMINLFFWDVCVGKKKPEIITIISILFITTGAIFVGKDSFSNDKFGYLVVLANNLTSLIYTKFSESFIKITGFSNLKLLVYNSYISNPVLLIGVFVSGEYKRLYEYLTNGNKDMEGTFYGLAFYLFISCSLVCVLNSSFFLSNEKNTSLLTNLLTSTKSIMTSFFLYLFDKEKNNLATFTVLGIFISFFGACLITFKTFFSNMMFRKKKPKKNIKSTKDNEDSKEQELIEVVGKDKNNYK